jgi:TolB-like protein
LFRQALGGDTRNRRFIETVSKRGYRLFAPVDKNRYGGGIIATGTRRHAPELTTQQQLIPGPERHGRRPRNNLYWILPVTAISFSVAVYLFHTAGIPRQAGVAGSSADGAGHAASVYPKAQEDKNSIAVLPVVNLSDNPINDYLCDGSSELLIGLLAGVHTESCRSYLFLRVQEQGADVRRMAEQLGVDTVLKGSVRLAGNHIRVCAQLIDATHAINRFAGFRMPSVLHGCSFN